MSSERAGGQAAGTRRRGRQVLPHLLAGDTAWTQGARAMQRCWPLLGKVQSCPEKFMPAPHPTPSPAHRQPPHARAHAGGWTLAPSTAPSRAAACARSSAPSAPTSAARAGWCSAWWRPPRAAGSRWSASRRRASSATCDARMHARAATGVKCAQLCQCPPAAAGGPCWMRAAVCRGAGGCPQTQRSAQTQRHFVYRFL